MTRQKKWLKNHPYYMQLWRLANKEKINESQKKRYRPITRHAKYTQNFIRNKAIIAKAKDAPCMDCHIKYNPYIMHFDHRNPQTKRKSVSQMSGYSEMLLREEIAKCDLVCANCHGLRTLEGVRSGKIPIFGGYQQW